MEIFILVFLILLNGFFVISEIVLVSSRKSKLESMAAKGDAKAEKTLELAESPEKFLPAVQIGITLLSILIGFYSGDKFSQLLSPVFQYMHIPETYSTTIATILIIIIVTFFSIVLGELIPKRLGLLFPESIAKTITTPIIIFSKIVHPFIWLLNATSNIFFKLFKISSTSTNSMTEDELKTILNEGAESGAIDEAEQEIIERVLHLGDRNITSLMTHHSDIMWFDVADDKKTITEKISKEPHSAYPVCDGDIDEIKGVISMKDLYLQDDTVPLILFANQALFVPENNTPYQVLESFKSTRQHCCFIVDEYGSVLGMITLTDILEALVGDIPKHDMEDYEIVERTDGSFLVDAQIPFYDFLDYFEKTQWMNEGEQEFDTLAGFILHRLEHIPHVGETLEWQGFKFEIVDMDGQRIDKMLVYFKEEESQGK